MHLLATQSGVVDGNAEAVDLAQTPGDIVIISAADSELASLANAYDALSAIPTLRLANQMALGHNLSVDTYIDTTAQHAKLIIARVLGGKAYWTYGVAQLSELARRKNIMLALLPGGNEQDAELSSLSTLPAQSCERIRQYIAHGGGANAQNLLKFCTHLLDNQHPSPAPPQELPKAGLYRQTENTGKATIAITFYRALIEGGLTAPVDALVDAITATSNRPVPIFVSSLKDPDCATEIHKIFKNNPPDVIINATGFATGDDNPFTPYNCPVLQAVFSGTSKDNWHDSPSGLPARDLAMNIVLPELDGRIMTRAVSFKADHLYHEPTQCRIVTYEPVPDRIDFTAKLAANWANLRQTPAKSRKLAIILANYPNRDGRIGNGVGYDTPASTISILEALKEAEYSVPSTPETGNDLIEQLQQGPTNAQLRDNGRDIAKLPLTQYLKFFDQLPETIQKQVTDRWGKPATDPFFKNDHFHLAVIAFGNVVVAIQPARGYNIDPTETYHDPALVPPHGYLAFYLWLRENFGAQAVIHNGKHGNLEWLPGKAVGLSKNCYPEIALGPMPQLYPFIVNDPGEGTQAKRRTSAVIIDHLTPPLTRAETYGPYRDLEALIDEYYLASGLDQRRLDSLRRQILDLTRSSGLDEDAGFAQISDEDEKLQQLDTYICELKEAQIRDGLHILGQSPQGDLETALLVALTRTPRGIGEGGDASLIRALAEDFGFEGFDPFDCVLGEVWQGERPDELLILTNQPWRTNGDTVERLELLADKLVTSIVIPAHAGIQKPNANTDVTALVDSSVRWNDDKGATTKVLQNIQTHIRPALQACGTNEIANLLTGLNGNFVPPGPSGAPTRGRLDVLPTGKNFYSVDNRAIPTPTAWTLGQKSAESMLIRHFQDHGTYPKAMGLSVWGTSNMRTGGDDIAQALALIGVKPKWDHASWRVTGYEIIPLAKLARPRIDITLRISGFFRDAFPTQIELFDKAVRDIGALDEPASDNPIATRMRQETADLLKTGLDETEAARLAGFRIFGSKPGAYGAGLQALIDEKLWTERADLAAAYITWGSYAYGKDATGERDEKAFSRRLKAIEAVVHNQDNREHDLLDSDDYYQFEGGMTAAVEQTSGTRPLVYHNDHSRPEKPVTRTLEEEIGRVMRSRVTNPKWINGVRRHGYKGAFEIAATIDYMFAFAATTGAVKSHHFELAYDAFINDVDVRQFIKDNNPEALKEIAERFNEALTRNLWTPKSNSAYTVLNQLMETTND
ncbi:Aerobic cobaltochelatase CobN subunit [hydrothermal vent metagenome]|uniref:Aerobic cobaltochelatase CobN subunit n=1 Tax=hydrothermal vent metagenome TaxID=652676 RepID=A0A3B0RMB2_9ZZZZ